MLLPSGEKRRRMSVGPAVSAASLPSATCLTQIRFFPSRNELKTTVLPSGGAD